MRSLILGLAMLILTGCATPPQRVVVPTTTRSLYRPAATHQTCRDCRSASVLVANEVDEPLPTDGLDIRLRIPPGWTVNTIQHNYVDFRSGRDSAFITVWCDDGSVQWGITYYTGEGEEQLVCRLGFQGEATLDEPRIADYQSYLDDADDSVMLYVNWPDIDALFAFSSALALREGGHCRPVSD